MVINMIDIMLKNQSSVLNCNWKSRIERSQFVQKFIISNNIESVLNLGSGGKRELQLPKEIKLVDVDFQGDVDIELNLDAVERLPFGDNAFDLLCAMDVLEHLEAFHLIVEEILRCSKKTVIIYLPNSAAEIPGIVLNKSKFKKKSHQGYFSKYYGLPLNKELDRHRYWLYIQDIIRYFEVIRHMHNLKVEYVLPKFSLKLRLLRLLIGSRLFYTFFLNHICIIISHNLER